MAGATRLRGAVLSWLLLLRQLPGYLKFAPLVAQSLFTRQPGSTPSNIVPGDRTTVEREWLTALARRTPDVGIIVQAGAPEADVTCALAAGCWASRRRVHVLWPQTSQEMRDWHQVVVRQGLAPYVVPKISPPAWNLPVDLLYGDAAKQWARHLKAGAVVVLAQAGPPWLKAVETCGGLTAHVAAID